MFTVEAFTRAVMLEFPFPLASCPVALCAMNAMSSSNTVPLTLLTVMAGPPVVDADMTADGEPAAYAHVPPVQVRAP